jgi:hypothetical protein
MGPSPMAQKRNSETGVASVDLPVQIWLALSASVPRFASADPQALGSLDWRKLTPIRKLKGGKWSLIVLSDHDGVIAESSQNPTLSSVE